MKLMMPLKYVLLGSAVLYVVWTISFALLLIRFFRRCPTVPPVHLLKAGQLRQNRIRYLHSYTYIITLLSHCSGRWDTEAGHLTHQGKGQKAMVRVGGTVRRGVGHSGPRMKKFADVFREATGEPNLHLGRSTWKWIERLHSVSTSRSQS